MAFDLATRILEGDTTIWGPNSKAPSNLGWLHLVDKTVEYHEDLFKWAQSVDQSKIIVLSTGDGALAPRVYGDFTKHIEKSYDREITVIDSTDPRSFADIDLTDTAIIVSSKSGLTIETLALFRFFFGRLSRPDRFYAITEPGSPLEDLAKETGFKRIFSAPKDVGGAFLAFTEFGIVPGALAGLDIATLFLAAKNTDLNQWVTLGESIGDQAHNSPHFIKLKYHEPNERSVALWSEHILSKCAGKQHKGLIPIPMQSDFGDYRSSTLDTKITNINNLGSHIYGTQFCALAAAYALGTDPFNVQVPETSKETILHFAKKDKSDANIEIINDDGIASFLVKTVPNKGFGSISYYQPTQEENALYDQHTRISNQLSQTPIALGIAPAHLHSTGQTYMDGPANMSVVQVVSRNYGPIVLIPHMDTDFASLLRAQANDEAHVLEQAGCQVGRFYI